MSCLETPSLRKPGLDTRRSGHKRRTGPLARRYKLKERSRTLARPTALSPGRESAACIGRCDQGTKSGCPKTPGPRRDIGRSNTAALAIATAHMFASISDASASGPRPARAHITRGRHSLEGSARDGRAFCSGQVVARVREIGSYGAAGKASVNASRHAGPFGGAQPSVRAERDFRPRRHGIRALFDSSTLPLTDPERNTGRTNDADIRSSATDTEPAKLETPASWSIRSCNDPHRNCGRNRAGSAIRTFRRLIRHSSGRAKGRLTWRTQIHPTASRSARSSVSGPSLS
jgi:hypothetical protein